MYLFNYYYLYYIYKYTYYISYLKFCFRYKILERKKNRYMVLSYAEQTHVFGFFLKSGNLERGM